MRKRCRRRKPLKHDWFSIIFVVLSLLYWVEMILLRVMIEQTAGK
mgnify:FL=1